MTVTVLRVELQVSHGKLTQARTRMRVLVLVGSHGDSDLPVTVTRRLAGPPGGRARRGGVGVQGVMLLVHYRDCQSRCHGTSTTMTVTVARPRDSESNLNLNVLSG